MSTSLNLVNVFQFIMVVLGCLLKLFPMLSFFLCLLACLRLFEVAERVLSSFTLFLVV